MKKITVWLGYEKSPDLKKLFRIMKLATFLILLSIGSAFASKTYSQTKTGDVSSVLQQKTITGTVLDEQGLPLPGVTVIVKGTTNGSVTDIDGKYSIANIPEGATLKFSFVGMLAQEIVVGSQSEINVSMALDAIGIEEIVAIGYGTQKKATVTGSIATVGGELLQKSAGPNLSSALAGKLPGLVVVQRTGQPGNDDAVMRIRGSNTLGNNSPLIVVDGIANRDFNRINPQTIETITVLKDASAAIYGAQAANGVILVTTKRGKAGKPTINITLNQGWTAPTVLPEMADAALYATLINEIKYYAGKEPKYTPEDIQQYADGSDPWGHPNTDWFEETIKPWAKQNYANMTLSGGADKVKYFVSMGYTYQDGMYKDGATDYTQADFRSNLDAEINDYIRLSLDVSGRQENRNESGVSGGGALDIFWAMNRAYPYLPATWPTGEPGPDVEYGANPTVIVTDATGYDRKKDYILETNLKLVVDIPGVEGLSLTANASVDKGFTNRKRWRIPWYLYSWDGTSVGADGVPELTAGKRGPAEPNLTQWMDDRQSTTLNALLNYERTFDEKHAVKVLVGSERLTGMSENFYAYRRYFTSEALDQMFAGGESLKNNGGSAFEEARFNYFGRVNYAFNSKYLAEFVWRYDGSYIFPEETRFGFFPGVSLGWRVSEEDFWQNNALVNDLKIRGSWGQTGNDRIAPYQFMTTYGYNSTYIFDGDDQQKTLTALRTPNPEVTWEVANQTNIGFDMQMFDGKLIMSGDYFYNLRTNILYYRNASVPASTGLSLPRENIGEVINQGFEFVAGWNDKINDFTYHVSANVSYAKNKIKFWDETPGRPEYQQSTGSPMGANLYYQAIGVFYDQAAVDAYPHHATARPGDIIFEDVNDDGVINGLDRVRHDKSNIPTLTGGLNVDLGYKNFYATALLQGAAGAVRAYRTFSGEAGNFLVSDVENRWTEDNPNSTYPRTNNRSLEYWQTDGLPNNTYWVRPSDYLRLKTVELGYNFSPDLIGKIGIEGLRIYFSGQNLLTFTKMTDHDPESPDTSTDGSIWVNSEVYPLNKVLSFGLSVTF